MESINGIMSGARIVSRDPRLKALQLERDAEARRKNAYMDADRRIRADWDAGQITDDAAFQMLDDAFEAYRGHRPWGTPRS